MESSDLISAVLHHKGTQVWSTTPDATVFKAIELMAEKDVGALLVMEGGQLTGLITEREYTREVILKDKSSRNTPVREIMISRPVTIGPSETVGHAMQIMTDRHFRYLPVLSEGKVIGIVSIGDLVKWIISAQGALIGQLEGYIKGSYPA